MSGWYYEKIAVLGVSELGPFSDAAILQMAFDGKLNASTNVKHETHTQGQWVPLEVIPAANKKLAEGIEARKLAKQELIAVQKAEREQQIKELATIRRQETERQLVIAQERHRETVIAEPRRIYATVLTSPQNEPATVPCRFCHEPIIATAIKCKHCSEYLDGRVQQVQQQPQAQPQQINVVQQTTVIGYQHYRLGKSIFMLGGLTMIAALFVAFGGQAPESFFFGILIGIGGFGLAVVGRILDWWLNG